LSGGAIKFKLPYKFLCGDLKNKEDEKVFQVCIIVTEMSKKKKD